MDFFIDMGALALVLFGSMLIGSHYGLDMGAAAFCMVCAIAPPFEFEDDTDRSR